MTDEDKQWFKEQLGELGQTVGIRLGKMDDRLDKMEDGLRRHKLEMSEKLEAMETRLLTAFHNWASPVEARLRTHTALLRAVDLEMESLGERVKRLEPGPAQ